VADRGHEEWDVRRAQESDAGAIAGLIQQLGYSADAATTRQRLVRILGREDHLVVVGRLQDGSVCAWLHAHASDALESGFRVEIVGLVVGEHVRRKGIGQELVAEAQRWAGSLGAEAIIVRSNIKRTESHLFYPALGYTESKTQRVYKKQAAELQNAGEPTARDKAG
jgi:N-acetylglutamate synthase-like GNAT family acetyltransferase